MSETKTVLKMEPIELISLLIRRLLLSNEYSKGENNSYTTEIYDSLKLLLNREIKRCDSFKDNKENWYEEELQEHEFQSILANLNEKQDNRKENGVYNTPEDVTDFIITNSFSLNNRLDANLYGSLNQWENHISESQIYSYVFQKTVFDPTCGSGEFIIQAMKIKLRLLKLINKSPDNQIYLDILSTIYGNDKDLTAIEICITRVFFEYAKYIDDEYYSSMAQIIKNNFTVRDFAGTDLSCFSEKFDIIIGNPPYVEKKSANSSNNKQYGNLYADVLHNSINLLTEKGTLGFVIPISYISTSRMHKIRKHIERKTAEQIILNFADRPSCLFRGVHQKLCILFATKQEGEKHKVKTSNYKHWYKGERQGIFEQIQITENNYLTKDFYPKLANEQETSIYSKIHTTTANSIYNEMSTLADHSIYIAMRACFWIKAFSNKMDSAEFKEFKCPESIKWVILAILNSSLFYFHWVSISDCWHLTTKELITFKFPKFENKNIAEELTKLSKQLENELENTKATVNTRQTQFEYKHKVCKPIIDQIDDILAQVYELTEEECEYVKRYCEKYRLGLGANSESN
jgi:type I restriction-modification system DNA methylase subunit